MNTPESVKANGRTYFYTHCIAGKGRPVYHAYACPLDPDMRGYRAELIDGEIVDICRERQ